MERDIGVRKCGAINNHDTTARTVNAIFDGAADRGAVVDVASRLVRRARLSARSHITIHEETHMKRLTYTVTEAAAIPGISRTSTYQCLRRGGRSRR